MNIYFWHGLQTELIGKILMITSSVYAYIKSNFFKDNVSSCRHPFSERCKRHHSLKDVKGILLLRLYQFFFFSVFLLLSCLLSSLFLFLSCDFLRVFFNMLDRILTKLGQNYQWVRGYKRHQRSWRVTGVKKVIFTKNVSTYLHYVAGSRNSCILMSFVLATKVINHRSIRGHLGSQG